MIKELNNSLLEEILFLCLTSDNKLFSWGKNDLGQLGIGQLNKHKIFKPQLIDYFNNKTIVQVCCGYYNSAVLTSDNCVLLWGYYKKYINYNDATIIKSPMKYELKEEIKLIHCSKLQKFCVTKCGKVYYWEVNSDKKMKAISIESLKNIQGIGSSIYHTYFISDYSTIYSINNDNKSLFSEIKTKLIIRNPIFELKFQSNLNLRSKYVLYNDNSV